MVPGEEIFKEEGTVGRLMRVTVDPITSYKFDIWFDYTKKLVNILREGDLVAIPNFSNSNAFSICQLIQTLPLHFAMPQDLDGYPGFSMEAVKNASQDWLVQETQSYEDTTKIICKGVPIGIQFSDIPGGSAAGLRLEEETSIVMPGREVKLLSDPILKKIFNKDINLSRPTFELGHLIKNDNVPILFDVEYFLKLHFGIFGFTGVGKSNLISTLLRKILKSDIKIKIILFDVANEYTALLIDLMSTTNTNAYLVGLSLETFPDSVINYIGEEVVIPTSTPRLDSFTQEPETEGSVEIDIDDVARALLNATLFPKSMDSDDIKTQIYPYIKKIVNEKRIRIISQLRNETIGNFLDRNKDESRLPPARISEINDNLETWLGALINDNVSEDTISRCIRILRTNLPGDTTVRNRIEHLIRVCNKTLREFRINIKEDYRLTMDSFLNDLNDNNSKSLYILTSNDPNELRLFSKSIVTDLYENRRIEGTKTPLVLFMVDEADEFIPNDPSGSYGISTQAIEMIARRGRKYGLGLGLATQRVTYLNTSIMAQPHTYFVSRLPRLTDRERVAEAFSMDEDLFQQTFKFKKGDWLVMSHEALGIQGSPIPITIKNAEDDIRSFLRKPFGDYTLETLS
jgi:hypothetical protein